MLHHFIAKRIGKNFMLYSVSYNHRVEHFKSTPEHHTTEEGSFLVNRCTSSEGVLAGTNVSTMINYGAIGSTLQV